LGSLITDEIVDNIVQHTNQYIIIIIIQPNFSSDRVAKFTDKIEIKEFNSLLCLSAALPSNKQSLEELWGTDGDGTGKFRLVMSWTRLKFLITHTIE
jgi:hypothetical protein